MAKVLQKNMRIGHMPSWFLRASNVPPLCIASDPTYHMNVVSICKCKEALNRMVEDQDKRVLIIITFDE